MVELRRHMRPAAVPQPPNANSCGMRMIWLILVHLAKTIKLNSSIRTSDLRRPLTARGMQSRARSVAIGRHTPETPRLKFKKITLSRADPSQRSLRLSGSFYWCTLRTCTTFIFRHRPVGIRECRDRRHEGEDVPIICIPLGLPHRFDCL